MQYLHTMVRVKDLNESLHFYCALLGLRETRRKDHAEGRFTLVFLAAPGGNEHLELTHNWDPEECGAGRNFGHLAYSVENLHQTCKKLQEAGVPILRPPRDGRMAFVKSPDGIAIELLQQGEALPPEEPWRSMPNQGSW